MMYMVVTEQDVRIADNGNQGFSEDAATQNAAARTERAEKLGVKVRYKVAPLVKAEPTLKGAA